MSEITAYIKNRDFSAYLEQRYQPLQCQVRTGRVYHWIPCQYLSEGCIPARHQSLTGVVEIQLINFACASGGQTERLADSRKIVASEIEVVLGD